MQLYWCVLLVSFLVNYGVVLGQQVCYDERDCAELSRKMPNRNILDSYCSYWRDDAAVKQCRNTCQFCKPYAQECKDELENCKDIASHFRSDPVGLENYCQQNKDNSVVQKCKATCQNLCIQDITFPPYDCKDEEDICSNIAKAYNGEEEKIREFCERHKDDPVVQKCKRTCRQCISTQKPSDLRGPSPNLAECNNEPQRCKDIAKMHNGIERDILAYCERHKDVPSVQKCKKTCQKCRTVNKAPIEPKECKDEMDRCYDIVFMHKGVKKDIKAYCDKHKNNPVVKKCKKTCKRFCDKPK